MVDFILDMCGAEGAYMTSVKKAREKHYHNIERVEFFAASHWDGYANDGPKGGKFTQNWVNFKTDKQQLDKNKLIKVNQTLYNMWLVNDDVRNNYL